MIVNIRDTGDECRNTEGEDAEGGAGDERDSAQGDGEGERGRHWGKHADKRQQARATDGTEDRRNRRYSGVDVALGWMLMETEKF